MSVTFTGRLRTRGSAGLGVTRRGGRCEFDFADVTLDLNDEQARMLRDALVSLYGPPPALQRQLQGKPARRMVMHAVPPEALAVFHSLTHDWCDTETVVARLDQPRHPDEVRRYLHMLVNAGMAARRVEPNGARRAARYDWRVK